MAHIVGTEKFVTDKHCKYSSSVTKSAILDIKGEVRPFLEKYRLLYKSMILYLDLV
ncbi:hypothetical protein [Clostridium pasteurianum]|uniref:Uncharacterized protein n=1 Tax=Clostridium pasteurianum BC1 TaxID=86416 RepID=R4JZ38_CLOPA|nr:hypothetical protein [Clostridium pasteurianum]AGK95558.1 hypothetical protein Clopa_0507 [Clostridium pasteurianum BC1]